MPAEVRLVESQVQGFHALSLKNPILSLTMIPELGGKISSIRDLRTNREWLWNNAHLPYRHHVYGTSYIQEADTGGWDECFPTVAECSYPSEPWKGLRMPDHGEIWPNSWAAKVEGNASTQLSISTEVQGVALPYEFRRTISLHANSPTVRFDYSVRSLADSALNYIWSAHPLFVVEPGMQILLPEDTPMRAWSSFPPGFVSDKEEHIWPVHAKANGNELDLSHMPNTTAGIACKLWSQSLSQGYAALVAKDGEFRFTFDPIILPQVGLWVNAGGWSGTGGEPYYNLALEPCIGAQDSLEEAVEHYRQYKTLPAHEVHTWWLEVHLHQ